MTEAVDCVSLRTEAAELALGTLEGTPRGAALAHLAGCPACRAHVQELTEAVDLLLAMAPEAEPPAGFESAVIDRIVAEGRGTVTRLPRRRRWLGAAAAVVLLAAGIGVGLLAGGDTGADQGAELASASMVAPGGETVGEVWRYGGDEAVLFVAVPAWADIAFAGPHAPAYALRLELGDGSVTEVGDFTLGSGQSSWGIATELDGADIAAVSVVDDTGHVWCTGRFAGSA